MIYRTLIACLLLFLLACSPQSEYADFEETKGGLKYKIHTSTADSSAKVGDMLKVHKTTFTENDSLVTTSRSKEKPLEIIIDEKKDVTPILTQLTVGDSVTILAHTDSIIGSSDPSKFPDYLQNNDYVKKSLVVVEHVREFQIKQTKDKTLSKQAKKDIKKIKKYLKENNIEAQSTESGIHYKISKEGTGQSPSAGDKVVIHLVAKVMGGQQYYSTHDIGSPIDFVIGKNPLVPALNDICETLKPGGKGTFYVPSPFAFGEKGKGDKVPPNSIMIFDVELLKVQKGPEV